VPVSPEGEGSRMRTGTPAPGVPVRRAGSLPVPSSVLGLAARTWALPPLETDSQWLEPRFSGCGGRLGRRSGEGAAHDRLYPRVGEVVAEAGHDRPHGAGHDPALVLGQPHAPFVHSGV
jgi:hypothetical protein